MTEKQETSARRPALLAGMEQRAEKREKDRGRYESARDALQKFALAGNAGGAIAALSLIGTTIARSQPPSAGAPPTAPAIPSYPAEYFGTLLVFVLGLAGGWVALSAKARRVKAELRGEAEFARALLEAQRPVTLGQGHGVPTPTKRRVPLRVRLARAWAAASTEDLGVAVSAIMLLIGTLGGLGILASLARW